MSIKIAINGFGRIGRCVLRSIYERNLENDIQVVAINELADIETMSYMLRYDSTHGRFPHEVQIHDDQLLIDGDAIQVFHHKHIDQLPWQDTNVDVVLDCTGKFKSHEQLSGHIKQGAKKVLLSQPGDSDVDYTFIAGVNDQDLTNDHKIVSVGSCSTNCVLPIMKILDEMFHIESGMSTTIHSAMNDQSVIDAYSKDLRRTRAAVTSIIPVDTALPKGIARIMPHLDGRIESLHMRVPTLNVSAMDLTLQLKHSCSVEQINGLLKASSEQDLKHIIGYSDEPHASVDFNHDAHSGVVDGTQTRVSGNHLLKLLVWFDNEWGFANRMVDVLQHSSFNQDVQSRD